MKKFMLCVCFLILLTPSNGFSDLIWLNTGISLDPIQYHESRDKSGDSGGAYDVESGGWYFDIKSLKADIDFPRFSNYLGALNELSLNLDLTLERQHSMESVGCRFLNNDVDNESLIENFIIFKDGGIIWKLGEQSLLLSMVGIWEDFFALLKHGITDPNLGFWEPCPLGVVGGGGIFPDYCFAEKNSPDLNFEREFSSGYDPQYVGPGTWKMSIGADIQWEWDWHRHVYASNPACLPGAHIDVSSEISGRAFVQGYYSFAPAVDVFVSSGTGGVYLYRYNGSDVVKELFIAPGEGGLGSAYGMAFTAEGDLLVISNNYSTDLILRFDGQTGAFEGVFYDFGGKIGAHRMLFGPDKNLYVLCNGGYFIPLRVMRLNGQTGEYMGKFAEAPDDELGTGGDLAFGPYGDLYVTTGYHDSVLRFNGETGAYKDIFINSYPEPLWDIDWPENSASFFLVESNKVNEYKIDPGTKKAVFWDTVMESELGFGTNRCIEMGPRMHLGETYTSVPSLFVVDPDGVAFYSPPRPRTKHSVDNDVPNPYDMIVRPHVHLVQSRDVSTDSSLISFSDAGSYITVQFSEITTSGTLNLAVAERAPGQNPTGFKFLGTYYEFSVHDGLTYSGDIEICIDIPPDAAGSNPQIEHWNGSSWDPPISSSVIGNRVCATFPSLSWFGISLNQPPVAQCQDITVPTDSGACTADVSVDNGSSDPDGDPITLSQSPAAPYSLGVTEVTLSVTDDKGMSDQCTATVTVEDQEFPTVNIIVPVTGGAMQDGVTFKAEASDPCGMSELYFYVREPDGAYGTPIGYEDLEATLNAISEEWEHSFDTTALLDGHYVILARAIDMNGNETWSDPVVPFSIRNWAVISCLPACEFSKAGRMEPVKFKLMTSQAVDPEMPFVYNEELLIKIYNENTGELEEYSFGDHSTDYRIDTSGDLYITNYKTDKRPATYRVEIWRPNNNDFKVGEFCFETVK